MYITCGNIFRRLEWLNKNSISKNIDDLFETWYDRPDTLTDATNVKMETVHLFKEFYNGYQENISYTEVHPHLC